MNTAKGKTDYTTSEHRRDHSQYVGMTFNRWKILRILPELSKNGSVLCEAECSCSKHTRKIHLLASIRSGKSHSCGCLAHEMSSERGTIDLTGKVFHDLTVLHKVDGKKASDGSNIWLCQCKCGNLREVPSAWLIRGATKSCSDCATQTTIAAVKATNTKYTDDERRIVHIFKGMVHRCTNPNSTDYLNYGKRGIYVCDEWMNSPQNFVNWSFANGYANGLTIDRIDVNGPYAPWNCRWATPQEQSDNRRNSVKIKFGNFNLSSSECSELTGMAKSVIIRRPDFAKDTLNAMFKNGISQTDLEIARCKRDAVKFMRNNQIKIC